ncbi:hypothetical protein BDW59DRAFT_54937 [Aspergillus cavernicola]|uniref:Uncharacterized protein n=1 Tax=Aspergillus cavernicola TaxID=176166 RepID=A0ABR4IJ76_9EURO
MGHTSTDCFLEDDHQRKTKLKAIDQTKDATSESLRALVQLHGFNVGLLYHSLYHPWPKRKRASYHRNRGKYGNELNPAPERGRMQDYCLQL